MRTIPEIKIRTIEDIIERDDLKIFVRIDSGLDKIVQKDKLDMYYDWEEENMTNRLIKGFDQKSHAYLNDKFILLSTLIDLNISIDNVHISEEDTALQPYFIIVLSLLERELRIFNFM